MIGFGLLQPAKTSDWVWLGLISFGPLHPTKKSNWYGKVYSALHCYNLQRKVIGYGWV